MYLEYASLCLRLISICALLLVRVGLRMISFDLIRSLLFSSLPLMPMLPLPSLSSAALSEVSQSKAPPSPLLHNLDNVYTAPPYPSTQPTPHPSPPLPIPFTSFHILPRTLFHKCQVLYTQPLQI